MGSDRHRRGIGNGGEVRLGHEPARLVGHCVQESGCESGRLGTRYGAVAFGLLGEFISSSTNSSTRSSRRPRSESRAISDHPEPTGGDDDQEPEEDSESHLVAHRRDAPSVLDGPFEFLLVLKLPLKGPIGSLELLFQ